MDIVYHLKKMEEVLRTAPSQNTLEGLIIALPEDTAQLWRNVVLEILAAAQQGHEADADQQPVLKYWETKSGF